MYPCGRTISRPITRRQLLQQLGCGFGAVALSALMADRDYGGAAFAADNPLAPRPSHYAPQVRSVIFLYMDGGPSQVDTFDPKPQLDADHGKPFKMKIEPTQFNDNGKTFASPWKFRRYGQSGTPVSDLFPHVGQCIDDIVVIRSMTSEFSEHTNANYFLHTGSGLQGRPSMGAWAMYGLGSECQNLPGFIVLNGGLIPPGGLDNFNSGFLPATYQGSVFVPGLPGVANAARIEERQDLQDEKLALMRKLDAGILEQMGHSDAVESAIANYELAYRMQMAVPELMELSGESAAIQRMYGVDSGDEALRTFGTECLLARRLVERGVRFIELTCPGGNKNNADRWDHHGGLRAGHARNAQIVDQPIAALLKDLKLRGLLETTLVLWSGEFGRTPFAQGSDGRDHNPFGFSCWLAGGGVKGGTVYGATDEYGYKAIENRVTIHDLHATMLHLMGIDHKKLTYRFSGRDMRLTDVFGDVVHDILA